MKSRTIILIGSLIALVIALIVVAVVYKNQPAEVDSMSSEHAATLDEQSSSADGQSSPAANPSKAPSGPASETDNKTPSEGGAASTAPAAQ